MMVWEAPWLAGQQVRHLGRQQEMQGHRDGVLHAQAGPVIHHRGVQGPCCLSCLQ